MGSGKLLGKLYEMWRDGITRERKDAASCSMRKGKCFLASSHGNSSDMGHWAAVQTFPMIGGGGSGDMGY